MNLEDCVAIGCIGAFVLGIPITIGVTSYLINESDNKAINELVKSGSNPAEAACAIEQGPTICSAWLERKVSVKAGL